MVRSSTVLPVPADSPYPGANTFLSEFIQVGFFGFFGRPKSWGKDGVLTLFPNLLFSASTDFQADGCQVGDEVFICDNGNGPSLLFRHQTQSLFPSVLGTLLQMHGSRSATTKL